MKDEKEDSLKILMKDMEAEQAALKEYTAKSELMASTLRTILEMYRLTGTKESQGGGLNKRGGLKLNDGR